MIEIVTGSASIKIGKRRHIFDHESGPFEVDPAVEADWVSKGVARYVGKAPSNAENANSEHAESEPTVIGTYEGWTNPQLKKELDARGIEVSGRPSKQTMIDLLLADDDIPTFDPFEVQ